MRNHTNLKPPEKENNKLIDDLGVRNLGGDAVNTNQLHMRNINKDLSLIEVENYHAMIANVKEQPDAADPLSQVGRRPLTATNRTAREMVISSGTLLSVRKAKKSEQE